MDRLKALLRKVGKTSLRGGLIGAVVAAVLVTVWMLLKEISLRHHTQPAIDVWTIDFSLIFSIALYVGGSLGAGGGVLIGGVVGLLTGIFKPWTLHEGIAKNYYNSTLKLR